jgi:hypothetical protein
VVNLATRRTATSGTLRITFEYRPGEEDEDGHETVPRDLNHDVGQHEHCPTVSLGRTLSDLIEISLCGGKSQKED